MNNKKQYTRVICVFFSCTYFALNLYTFHCTKYMAIWECIYLEVFNPWHKFVVHLFNRIYVKLPTIHIMCRMSWNKEPLNTYTHTASFDNSAESLLQFKCSVASLYIVL